MQYIMKFTRQVLQNKVTHKMTSPTPVPMVYSTPSTQQQTAYTTPSGQHTISLSAHPAAHGGHTVISGNPVTAGRQITFLTSPVNTPTTVSEHQTIRVGEVEHTPTQGAIRRITLK